MMLLGRALMFTLLVWGAAGCAARQVPAHAVPELAPSEGLLALAVDTDTPFEALVFSHETGIEGFTIAVPGRGTTMHVLKVPEGRYVLTDFRTLAGGLSPAATGGRLCLEVKAAAMTYPGHFVFRNTNRASGLVGEASWGWRPNEADASARLGTKWPTLTARYPPRTQVCR